MILISASLIRSALTNIEMWTVNIKLVTRHYRLLKESLDLKLLAYSSVVQQIIDF